MKNINKELEKLIRGLSTVSFGQIDFNGRPGLIKGIAVVGPSCSGKTTLIDRIRASKLCLSGQINVPFRYVTRHKRLNDIPGENVYITKDEFAAKVKENSIYFHWGKKLDQNRQEMFGFQLPAADTVSVYSANNGLIYNKDTVYPKEIFDSLMIVGVYAPDGIRRERILARSPDIARDKPDELKYRLADTSEIITEHVHVLINNYGPHELNSGLDLLELVGRIVKK